MTNHPLTDELLQQIGCSNPRARVFDAQSMRAAYDKGRDEGHAEMLEAVSRWTKRHAWSYMEQCQYEDDHEFNDSKFIAHLKKAMRPTTQEDN